MIKSFWHLWLSIQNPKVVIVWTWNYCIFIILTQSNNPILSSNIKSFNKFNFKFCICTVFWNGFSCGCNLTTISDAFIENFNTLSIRIKTVSGNSMWATSLKIVRDDSLFIPSAKILCNINIWDRNWFFQICSQWLLINTIIFNSKTDQ